MLVQEPKSGTAGLADETRTLPSKRREMIMFLVLAVVIWPFIAVGVVATWGFLVWFSQILFFGPPGPR